MSSAPNSWRIGVLSLRFDHVQVARVEADSGLHRHIIRTIHDTAIALRLRETGW